MQKGTSGENTILHPLLSCHTLRRDNMIPPAKPQPSTLRVALVRTKDKKDNGITHRNIITNGVQSKINKQHSQKKRGGTRGKRVPKRNR